jgi:hypothetical protein
LITTAGQAMILAEAAGMRLADDVSWARSRHRTAQVGDAA